VERGNPAHARAEAFRCFRRPQSIRARNRGPSAVKARKAALSRITRCGHTDVHVCSTSPGHTGPDPRRAWEYASAASASRSRCPRSRRRRDRARSRHRRCSVVGRLRRITRRLDLDWGSRRSGYRAWLRTWMDGHVLLRWRPLIVVLPPRNGTSPRSCTCSPKGSLTDVRVL
jgi:hypothetical protein